MTTTEKHLKDYARLMESHIAVLQDNARLREALEQALYALQVPIVSCQKGVIQICKCRKCAIERADDALSAANYVQPQAGREASGFTEAQFDEALSERDRYHEVADDLAAQIAAITGEDIGAHSSANDPWHNAMLAADEFVAKELRKLLAHRQATEPAWEVLERNAKRYEHLRDGSRISGSGTFPVVVRFDLPGKPNERPALWGDELDAAIDADMHLLKAREAR